MIQKLKENISKCFVGKDDVVENLLICLLSGGHVLIEDAPGLGKTTLAAALSKSIQCSFGRIQCTPDTLPSDITGVTVFDSVKKEFSYHKGVIMNQLLLVDEINRATPKTQSSLLEAMAEKQVTVDGEVHKLDELFMVIATQNPVEYIGTYPLPEAQMDRFMMRLSVGYPNKEQEMQIARQNISSGLIDSIASVCTPDDILNIRKEIEGITVSDAVLSYMADIVRITREEERFVLGASPRAMIALMKASMVKAYILGRDYVKPDDVKAVAEPVLLHRFVLTNLAKSQRLSAQEIFKSLLLKVKVPV